MHKSDSIFVDFNIKEKIRKTELSGTEIGGASSFPFMKENDNPAKPLIALEIPYNIDDGYPDIIKEKWQGKSLEQMLEEANNSNADIISIKFNISENSLNEKTSEIKDFKLVGTATNKGGVFSFQVGNIHPQDLAYVLGKEGVAIRIGHHCAEPLVNRMGYTSLARASFGLYNTKEDIDAFVAAVKKASAFF